MHENSLETVGVAVLMPVKSSCADGIQVDFRWGTRSHRMAGPPGKVVGRVNPASAKVQRVPYEALVQ